MTSPDNKTKQKKIPGIRYCRCIQEKTCFRFLDRKIWRRNGTAWAYMASKETGSLNEVAANGKSSRRAKVYRAALSVRKILQNQQVDTSFGNNVPKSYPRVYQRWVNGASFIAHVSHQRPFNLFYYERQNKMQKFCSFQIFGKQSPYIDSTQVTIKLMVRDRIVGIH